MGDFTLTINDDQLTVILGALGKLQFDQAFPVIREIQKQVGEQRPVTAPELEEEEDAGC